MLKPRRKGPPPPVNRSLWCMLSPVTGAKMLRWMLSIMKSHPGWDTSMDESTHMDKLTSLKITCSGSMMRSTTWGSRVPIACASLGSTSNPSRARCMKPQRLSAARPMSYSIAKESTMDIGSPGSQLRLGTGS